MRGLTPILLFNPESFPWYDTDRRKQIIFLFCISYYMTRELARIPVKRFQQYFHWFPGFVHLNDWLSLNNISRTTALCYEPVWLTERILPNPFTLLNCRFGSSSYLVVHISLVYIISLPNISGNDDLDCSGFTQRHVFGYIVLQNAQNYRKNLPFLLKLEIYFVIR